MYLKWAEQTVTDFSEENIERQYGRGFVFTRLGKGVMQQTRSLRVDLSKFELSSENRRILKKIQDLRFMIYDLPYKEYSWRIHKLGAHFYTTKFGNNIFSANKIKEIMTSPDKHAFNRVLVYKQGEADWGYCVGLETQNIFHYSYPFYDLALAPKEMGLGMMTRAVAWAKESGKQYFYLGSAQRPADTYKLQFAGIEWWDGTRWQTDLDTLRGHLRSGNVGPGNSLPQGGV